MISTTATAEPGLAHAPTDETVLAMADCHGWRFEPAEIAYDRRTVLMGGPIGWLITGTLSALGNYRVRHEAERLAAPQWRPLGPLVVQATQERFLVWHNDQWWPVWYSGIAGHECSDRQLVLYFESDSPYLLSGDVDDITQVIVSQLGHEAG